MKFANGRTRRHLPFSQHRRSILALVSIVPFLAPTWAHAQSQPQQQRWSDPATWPERGYRVPAPGAEVVIDGNRNVLLDQRSTDLGSLRIAPGSTVSVDEQAVEITLNHIVVQGTLELGTSANPFTGQLTVTLNGVPGVDDFNGMGTRGIFVVGGTLLVHGQAPDNTWARLTSTNSFQGKVSGTQIRVKDGPNPSGIAWPSGDEIAISPTDYFDNGPNTVLVRQIQSSLAGGHLSITPAIRPADARWAQPQYLLGEGPNKPAISFQEPLVSLPETLPHIPDETPHCIDQRAYVGNLTRNIKIQAPLEDPHWEDEQFGVHIMIMRTPGGSMPFAQIEGVEIRRAGQRNILGRYPFHWHMLSYAPATPPTGLDDCEIPAPFDQNDPFLGLATDQYFRKNSIRESRNRGVVIHGTNGVEVAENVLYDIEGHGIFLEDGAERDNVIADNLILKVRNTS